jgi:hypothetical protein
MVKPLEYEMCKELETVKHIMFECIVAKLLWAIVERFFDCNINNFESIASKWFVGTPVYHPEFPLCIQFMIPGRPS